MKRFALTLTILCALCALTWAGTDYSGKDKEVIQQAPPPCEWYRAHEWDFDFWGTFAFAANTGNNHPEDIESEKAEATGATVDLGHVSNDRFMGRDNVWGGGVDVKYFISKYWGIGAEGFILDTKHNIGGAGLGTFTFRYPIGCSRFAPYAFGGVGALGGGSHSIRIFYEPKEQESTEFQTRWINNSHVEAIGQAGAGVEVRITHHIGMMGDFAWNFVSGSHNDFGMARFGVTLSY
jgi:hypothetical protein